VLPDSGRTAIGARAVPRKREAQFIRATLRYPTGVTKRTVHPPWPRQPGLDCIRVPGL